MRTHSSKVQSSNPESNTSSPLSNQFEQSFVLTSKNPLQLQGCRMSSNHLSKILDASNVAQKMAMKLTMEAISPTTSSNLDWKFINCYLDSTVLLLDACNNIQLRLESIRSCLDSIPIALHYLEGEHEPSWAVMQRAVAALESSRFRQKQHCNKKEKIRYRMRALGKKLSGCKLTSTSPDLYKALSGSWSMAVLAIGLLGFATSFRSQTSIYIQPSKAKSWTQLLKQLSNKTVFTKKSNKTTSMEELARVDLAVHTMLKLISARQKSGKSSLQRMAVKAVAEELKKRKEELEKTLLLFEEKIGELYKLIAALRINMLELLSKAKKGVALKILKPSNYEESQMDTNLAHYQWT